MSFEDAKKQISFSLESSSIADYTPYTENLLFELMKGCTPEQITELLTIKSRDDNKTILDDISSKNELSDLLKKLKLTSAEKLNLLKETKDHQDLIPVIQEREVEFAALSKRFQDFDIDIDIDIDTDDISKLDLPDRMVFLKQRNSQNKTPLDFIEPEKLSSFLIDSGITDPKDKYEVLLAKDLVRATEMSDVLKEVAAPTEKMNLLKMQQNDGYTALHYAKDANEIKGLLEWIDQTNKIELLNIKDTKNNTPLHWAKTPEKIGALLEGIDNKNEVVRLLTTKNDEEKTALESLDPKELPALLNDLKLNNEQKLTALKEMSKEGQEAESAKTLIDKITIEEKLVKLDKTDDKGITPLHAANGDITKVKEALKDIPAQDQVRLLKLKNTDGKTPLDYVKRDDLLPLLSELGLAPQQKYEVLLAKDLVRATEMSKVLKEVANSAEKMDLLKMQQNEGYTALHYAKDANEIKGLLDRIDQANKIELLNIKDTKNNTPLHWAETPEKRGALLYGIDDKNEVVRLLTTKNDEEKTALESLEPKELEGLLNNLGLSNEQKLEVLLATDLENQKTTEIRSLIEQTMAEQDIENSKVKQKVADLGGQDPDLGLSPLHRANGDIGEIAKSLKGIPALDQVTLLKIKDKSGKTPLDYVKPEELKTLLGDLKLDPKQQYDVLFNAGVAAIKEAHKIQEAAQPDKKFEMLKMKREIDGKTMLHMPKAAADIGLLLNNLTADQKTQLLIIPDAEGKTPLDNIPQTEVMPLLTDLKLEPKQKYEAMLNMKESLDPQDILGTFSAAKDVTEKLDMLKMKREDDGKTFLHGKPQAVMTALLMNIPDKKEVIKILTITDKDNKTALDYISERDVINLLDGESLKLDPKQKYEILLNTDRVDKVILAVLKAIPEAERSDMLKMTRDVDGKTILHIPRKTEDLKTVLDGVAPDKISELLNIKDKEGKTPLEKFSAAEVKILLDALNVPLPEQAKLIESVEKAEAIRITEAEAKAAEAARLAAAAAAPSVVDPNMPSQSPYDHVSRKGSSAHQLDENGKKTWRETDFKTEGGVTTAIIGDPNKGHFKQTKTADGKFEYEVVNSHGDSEDRIQVLTVPRKGGGKPDIIKFDKSGNVTFFEEGGPGGQSKIGPETMKKIQAFEEGKSLAHVAEEKAPAPKVVQKAEDLEVEKEKAAAAAKKGPEGTEQMAANEAQAKPSVRATVGKPFTPDPTSMQSAMGSRRDSVFAGPTTVRSSDNIESKRGRSNSL